MIRGGLKMYWHFQNVWEGAFSKRPDYGGVFKAYGRGRSKRPDYGGRFQNAPTYQ